MRPDLRALRHLHGGHLAPSDRNPSTHVLAWLQMSFMLDTCHLLICATVGGQITQPGILKRVIGCLAWNVCMFKAESLTSSCLVTLPSARTLTVPSWSRDLPDSKAEGGKAAHLICITGRALLVGHEIPSPGQHHRGMELYPQLMLFSAERLCFPRVNMTSCQCAWRCHTMRCHLTHCQ